MGFFSTLTFSFLQDWDLEAELVSKRVNAKLIINRTADRLRGKTFQEAL
jgi:hypothetical protein